MILSPSEVPEFAEEDGYAVPVAADTDALAVAPEDLGKEYVSFLKDGQPGPYAAGPHTTLLREERQKGAKRPGLATQYLDRVADQGDFSPSGCGRRTAARSSSSRRGSSSGRRRRRATGPRSIPPSRRC